jgi:hypothetical protein
MKAFTDDRLRKVHSTNPSDVATFPVVGGADEYCVGHTEKKRQLYGWPVSTPPRTRTTERKSPQPNVSLTRLGSSMFHLSVAVSRQLLRTIRGRTRRTASRRMRESSRVS